MKSIPESDQPVNPYQQGQVLLVNKPLRWTSFDVVRKIRNLTRAKTGHAGTLDPLATGLLICCTGRMTKKIQQYQAMIKEYTGTFTIGATTPTYDLESAPENFRPFAHITSADIEKAVAAFTGEIMQVPPAHSAIKQKGKPIYELARKGLAVTPEARKITIHTLEITEVSLPVLHFRVVCSTGTYIRSLASDFGKVLGCGAYLSVLCRTRIGDYTLGDASTMEELEKIISETIQH